MRVLNTVGTMVLGIVLAMLFVALAVLPVTVAIWYYVRRLRKEVRMLRLQVAFPTQPIADSALRSELESKSW